MSWSAIIFVLLVVAAGAVTARQMWQGQGMFDDLQRFLYRGDKTLRRFIQALPLMILGVLEMSLAVLLIAVEARLGLPGGTHGLHRVIVLLLLALFVVTFALGCSVMIFGRPRVLIPRSLRESRVCQS